MFDSLTKPVINWQVFGILSFFILLIPGLSLFSIIAILISLHQLFLLFYSLNYVLPIRYLFGFLMCIQMFIGPVFAYNGFDQGAEWHMQIPETAYFTYTIPGVILFILGLHYKARKLEGEVINQEGIKNFLIPHKRTLAYIFIGIGFFSSIISGFFSSEIQFVIFLIGGFKFIGVFMLIVSEKSLKPLPMVICYGSIISSSLGIGMFHDLITWMIFLGSVYCFRYKPNTYIKLVAAVAFLIGIIIIQELKGDYRTAIGKGQQAGGLETFSNTYDQKRNKNDGFFSTSSLAPSTVRINQGFIITYVMKNVPEYVPFQNGSEMMEIIEAAVLPRFLDPTKLKAGDRFLFEKYTGLNIAIGTSMALSSLGDAYVNFGLVGGCIFMFFLGWLYNYILKFCDKKKERFPLIIIFLPLVFYYPIRPDCELQTILGHLVKSLLLIYMIMRIGRKYFSVNPDNSIKKIEN